MDPLAKFGIGIVHGMGGPDLEKWIENLSGAAGKEVGKIVRSFIDGSGYMSRDGITRLIQLFERNPEIATEAVDGLLDSYIEESGDFSLIKGYLQILNFTVRRLKKNGRPLVLRGFLHRSDCLSYWHFDKSSADRLKDFTKQPNLELISFSMSCPKVYLLESEDIEADLAKYNLAIRKAQLSTLDYAQYSRGPLVKGISEFSITLGEGMVSENEVEIPRGAPAAIRLLASISQAEAVQRADEIALKDTLDGIEDEFEEDFE